MHPVDKLLFALQQTENIISLMKDNKYEQFFSLQLSPVLYELKRQLSLENTK